MTTNYKHAVLSVLLACIWTTQLWAQAPNYELSAPETDAQKSYVARDYIKLKATATSGFHFSATDANHKFSAKIDAGLLFPPTANTYALPNGTITTDPTQGAVVGSIPGQFGVSPSGGATYTIPIEVPPGINGMQPNVSVVYSSQGGNGIAGWGWNISGMSSISRTGCNLYNDSKISSPQLTTDDNLTLDGQRLILVSDVGTNLTNGAKYRTEIETYSDITFKSINGYVCFEVKTKEGMTMEFGSSADSYIHAQGSTVAITWLLAKVTDANGNYMTYSYGNDSNFEEFWLDKINYTCNDAAGITTGANEIDFIYTSERADSQTNYFVGKKMKQTHLLQSIKTITNSSTPQREYSFTYSIADGFYNKLTQIDEKGNDGTRYNPTIIDWNKLNSSTTPTFGFTSNNTAIGATFDNFSMDKTMIFVDIDNDGFVDLIRPKLDNNGSYLYTGWEMYKSVNGQNFGTTPSQKEIFNYDPIAPFSGQYHLYPVDVNGDGMSDIIEIRTYTDYNTNISYNNVDVLINVGGQLVRQGLTFSITGDAYQVFSFELGDYNGDGNVELLVKISNSHSIESGTIQMYAIDLNPNASRTALCTTSVVGDLTTSRTTDVNGNGLPEIFFPSSSGSKFMEYNTGSISFSEISFTHSLAPSINSELEFGDFNGDGKTDVLQYLSIGTPKWSILMSTGTGFESVSCPLTRSKTNHPLDTDPIDFYSIKDLNGDGKGDIIEVPVGSNNVNIYYYNGSSFSSTTHTITGASGFFNDRTLPYYDINGDGKSDIVNTTANSFSVISFSTTETERSVSTITNGMGIKNTIVYKFLSDNTIYSNGTSTVASPVVKLCVPMPVVSQAVSSVNSLSETTYYGYKGLKIHTKGKGMLGFEELTQDNVTQDKKSVTQFSYNSTYFNVYPTQQIVSRSTISGSQPISTTTYSSDVISLEGKRIFPYTSSQTTTDNLTGLSATSVTSDFDDSGNPQTITVTKATGISETKRMHYIQKGSWCKNKMDSLTQTNTLGAETFTRRTLYFYDEKGNLTKDIVDPGDVNSVTTEYKNNDNLGHIDYFGHVLLATATANGVSRSTYFTYTPSGRFLASKTNVLGETTIYSWNETKGQLDSETNRFGTTTYTYNGFGSVLETRMPDGIRKAQVLQWADPNNSIGARYSAYTETSGTAPVTVWHDALGREIQRDSYGLNANKISVTTEYYPNNKVCRVSEPYFEADAGTKIWAKTYLYDDYGRPQTLTTPLGLCSTEYNGKTTKVTTPESITETTVNDAGQTLTSKVNGKTVTYTYYASGLTHTTTPEGGQALTMVYDRQGKRTKLIDPDAGTVRTQYNGFGELVLEKHKIHLNQDSISTINTYSTNGLLQTIVRNGETTSYTYDPTNRISLIEITGKNKQTFTYDRFDRVTNVKEEIGTRVYNTGKEYDILGRVKKEIYPSGYYVHNTYDSYGNLSEVKDQYNRSIWKAIDENAKGQLLHISKGGKTTTFDFYDNGLTKEIKADGVVDMFYEFYNPTNRYTVDDKLNNLYSREDKLTGQKEKFRYDGMNRLTNWDVYQNNVLVKQNSMTFDATTSNITAKSDLGNLSMSYGGVRADGSAIGPHALATISGVPTSFPTADLIITYTDFKKIKTLSEGNKGYKLTYGVDDQRRVSKYSVGTDTLLTRYYLGGYEEEVNALGNVRKIHYLSGGAMLIQNNGSDSLLYAYSDFQGSLIALTDANGSVVEKYAYDPWGARRNAADWTQKDTRTKWISNRGYTGHEHLDVFGIINMNGRVYDPAIGMFMSPDPYVQAPDDWLNYNRYGYCMNNPFKYTDPSGKSWISDAFNWIGQNWKTIVTVAATVVVAVGVGVLTGGMGLAAAGFFAGGAGGLVSGALGTALNGGSLRDCIVAGINGAAIGAFTGLLGGAAASLAPAGIVWGALYGAATGGAIGGASSAMSGGDFWQGAAIGAALGAIGGGIAGGQKALASGQNAWWGNKIKYNRNQWSFINTNKPDYEIGFGIKDVGSQNANDCVPTTFAEIDEEMGVSGTYENFKATTNYVDENGVLISPNRYEDLMHDTFNSSEKLCGRDYSNLFNPDYMKTSASNHDVFSVLFSDHADNVRSLQVFTRDPSLNTLVFRQSSYNFNSTNTKIYEKIFSIFHISK